MHSARLCWHNKHIRRDMRQSPAAGDSGSWPPRQWGHAVSPGTPVLPLEATSHPSLGGCATHVAERAADQLRRQSCGFPWSRTQQTQVQPSAPASRGVPGQAEGFCTLELALRHSGGRKAHGGRCSDSAASSVLGGELFASLAARSAHAISGRA